MTTFCEDVGGRPRSHIAVFRLCHTTRPVCRSQHSALGPMQQNCVGLNSCRFTRALVLHYEALLCLNISSLCPIRFKTLLASSSSDGSQHCKEIEISDVKYNIFQVSASKSPTFLFCVTALSSKRSG